MIRRYAFALAALVAGTSVISGCVSHTVRSVDLTPPQQMSSDIPEDLLLDVGIAVFDPNVPDSYDEQEKLNIQPEIRRAESNYMPYFFKNLIQSTGNWGAVRVVPRTTHAVDVTVAGTIVHSDGERMVLRAIVTDARGEVWIDKVYETLASKYAYGDAIPRDIDPYQGTYKELADDMLAVRRELSDEDIREIRTTAEMKFALEFSPDAFATHVVEVEPDIFEVRRLPAPDDPNLERVRKVREREYTFIDALDEYYANFSTQMFTAYQDWRRATYDEAIAYREERNKARARMLAGAAAIVGGIAAQASDDIVTNYGGAVAIMSGAVIAKSGIEKSANAKFHAEVLQELGVSAETEIMPHTIELENQTLSLQGTVDQQYTELRRILRRIYHEELGLAVPDDVAPDPQPAAETAASDDDEFEDSIQL